MKADQSTLSIDKAQQFKLTSIKHKNQSCDVTFGKQSTIVPFIPPELHSRNFIFLWWHYLV